MSPLSRLLRVCGLDRAVFLALVGKVWTTSSGLVTALLIAATFRADVQGYYYTFLSVLAIQALAELGLGIVISSYSSHEWAHLGFDDKRHIVGDPDALSRLTSLARFALRWYVWAGVAMAFGLTVGGFVFFGSTSWSALDVWGAPWAVLCLVAGFNLCLIPFWSLLEGCNQVASVYAARLIQSIAVSLAAWLAIYAGAGLWVVPLMALVGALATLLTIGRWHGAFFNSLMRRHPSGPRLHWKADILPMQWRVALSWLSGYVTFSLFTPVLFHYHGAVVAGQMGMTWAFVGALTGVASSWIAPKAPTFGILIAQRKYAELDHAFWRLLFVVVAIASIGALAIWGFVLAVGWLQHPIAKRLLSPSETGSLLIATVIVCASLPMSAYLRAHKREPLLLPSLMSGLITGASVLLLGKHFAAAGVSLAYLLSMAIVTPVVAVIWQRRRVEWHAPSAAVA